MAKRKVSQKTLAALKRGRKTMAANRLAKKKAPARRRNPSSHMTFKSLAVGAVFVFASEEDPKFRFSGMARGPWVKVAPRTYEDADNGQRHRVGSINVKVILKNPAHGNFMNAIAAKARGGLGREAYQNPVRPLRNPTSPPLLQIASKHPRTRQIVYWGAFGWGPRNKALGFPSSAEAKKLALKMKRPVVIVSPSHTTVDIFGALNQ